MRQVVVALAAFFCAFSVPVWAAEPFLSGDRVLIVAAHPLDEKEATAHAVRSALTAGAEVKILYLTDGELGESPSLFKRKKPLFSRKALKKISAKRKAEAVTAAQSWGLEEKSLVFFGYPSGGLMKIWQKHWGRVKPYRSFFTRINLVPHKSDYSYGSYYTGENILADVKEVMEGFRPTRILATTPSDNNPDHRSAYLFTRAAMLDEPGLAAPVSFVPESARIPGGAAGLAVEASGFAFGSLPPEGEARYALSDSDLVIGVPLEIPFDARGVVLLRVYGHRRDTAFNAMPKLFLRLIGNRMLVNDGPRDIFDPRLVYRLEEKKLVVRIPLALINDPEHVFVSARVQREEKGESSGEWKILQVPAIINA